jgi:hypothetical protein
LATAEEEALPPSSEEAVLPPSSLVPSSRQRQAAGDDVRAAAGVPHRSTAVGSEAVAGGEHRLFGAAAAAQRYHRLAREDIDDKVLSELPLEVQQVGAVIHCRPNRHSHAHTSAIIDLLHNSSHPC